jgi:Tol biopolymer transport system component
MAVVGGLVGVALAVLPAVATYPGANGDIAYLKIGGSSLAIRAIAPDGTGDYQLSVGSTEAVDAEYTPDGASAVVAEWGGRRGRIVLQDLATSDRTVILGRGDVPDSGLPFSLGVSPDRASIVFCVTGRAGWRLYTVDVDGSNLTKISVFGRSATTLS